MKFHPMGTELFHADRQTDKTKLTVVFRNFANAPKKNYKTESRKFTECEISSEDKSYSVHLT